MFEFRDLFQWDRFITPTIIKTFYWLVIALISLFGISGIFSGLAAMAISPFGGIHSAVLSSIASVVVGVVFSRIVAEFILIVFASTSISARSATRPKCSELSDRMPLSVVPPQVLNRKCMTSPSATTYSLPSSRNLPASRAPGLALPSAT